MESNSHSACLHSLSASWLSPIHTHPTSLHTWSHALPPLLTLRVPPTAGFTGATAC